MNVHLAAEDIRDRGRKHAHDLGIARLDNALCKDLGIVKQVNVILQQIKTKFLNFEAAVGNTAHERMLEIALPDLARCIEQSLGCFVVFQGGTPNELMLIVS